MRSTDPGMSRYMYEYMFQQTLKVYPRWKKLGDLRASQGREARRRLETELTARGVDLDTMDRNDPAQFLASVDAALGSMWPDYTPMFVDAPAQGANQRHYAKMSDKFAGYVGDKGSMEGGARLPVSPFDPRWSNRETAMVAGTDLMSIPADLVDSEAGDNGDVDRLHRVAPSASFELSTIDVPQGWNNLRVLGPGHTRADVVGLSALRPYMSSREFAEHSSWALEATEPMAPAALERSVAVLEYLSENGIDYSIGRDRSPGQLVAKLVDSKAEIRITGAGEDGKWVGRVYDNGIVTRYSDKGGQNHVYEPTPQETVDLVRFALGEPVQRFDGSGVAIGVPTARTDALKQRQHSYHTTGSSGTATPGRAKMSRGQKTSGARLMLEARDGLWVMRDAKVVSQSTTWFPDEATAETFLREAVDSAREGMAASIDIEALIAEVDEHAFDLDYRPDFDGADERIVSLKQDYWSLLTDAESTVVLSDPSSTDAAAFVGAGDLREVVRAHAREVVAASVGDYEPDDAGKRFDPVPVATYMDSGHNLWRNNDDLVAACTKAGIRATELRGDDYFHQQMADNMLEFDASTAVPMSEHPSPMVRRLAARTAAAVSRGAADVKEISIDGSGVVQWTASRRIGIDDDKTPQASRDGQAKGHVQREVTGTLGQVFPVGEFGEVTTGFAGSDNFTFVPGMEAYVVAQRPGEDLSLEERTRLRTYEESMGRAIDATVSRDIAVSRSEVGRTTSLNSAVRRLAPSSDRHTVDFFAALDDPEISQVDKDFMLAQAQMGAARVRYPTAMGQGSNALAYRTATTGARFDPLNDNDRSWLIKTGLRNINELDREAGYGRFDPMATGTDANQGLVRYLTPGATVADDGSIVPSPTPQARVGVLGHEYMASAAYNPADRQIKATADAMRALGVDAGVSAAMSQLGGWNYEDGIVVSEEFAARNSVMGADGQRRGLMVGDKLSDMANNKGVVSLVVDRYMSAEQAQALELTDAVNMFSDNPGLDVVMSPFSPISRFNGGTAREMMADPSNLVVRDGAGQPTVVPGGIGPLNMMITHLTVDSKTNVYDADAVAAGRGRKASSQLGWALQSQGAYEVMRDLYSENNAASADLREYMLVLGMDLGPEGQLQDSISQDSLTGRAMFTMGDPIRFAGRANADPSVVPGINYVATIENFGKKIAKSGGLMEVPFELTMPDGSTTVPSPTTPGRYVLPLLSSRLRAEQDLGGGGVSRHDHTQRYLSIYEAGVGYLEAERLLNEAAADGRVGDVEAYRLEMDGFTAAGQRGCDSIGKDVIARRVESKTNMFKESLMGARQAHSATAVWSPDPRLEIDQVAMNRDMAIELGVRMMNEDLAEEMGVAWTGVDPDPEDGYVMIWRDPVLRDGAVRYMRVVIDESLTGVAVNPVTVKSMDGDFDGDSVGLVGGLSALAHMEAAEKLTVEANLLDRGQRVDLPVYENVDGVLTPTGQTRDCYPLGLHTGLDLEVACKSDPQLRPFIDTMTVAANEALEARDRGEIDQSEFCDRSRAIMAGLSGSVYRDGFASRDKRVALSFANPTAHMTSVQDCYLLGGKGGPGKLEEYGAYIGLSVGFDDQGLVNEVREAATPADVLDTKYRGSQAAMAFKSQITGIAGSISQNAIRLLRSQGLVRQACELSYPATQSVLQAKHDPVDAAYRADIITGPAKDLWSGYAMESRPDENGRLQWSTVRDRNNDPVQATRDQWSDQFMSMYADKAGMGVPVAKENVEAVAVALSDSRGTMLATDGKEHNVLPEDKAPLALDQLAYGRDFAALKELAKSREKLFVGADAGFAPSSVLSHENVRDQLHSIGMEYYGGRDGLGEQVMAQRKDTAVDFQRRLPRSEWSKRTTSVRPGVDPTPAAVAPVQAEVDQHAPAPVVAAMAAAGAATDAPRVPSALEKMDAYTSKWAKPAGGSKDYGMGK